MVGMRVKTTKTPEERREERAWMNKPALVLLCLPLVPLGLLVGLLVWAFLVPVGLLTPAPDEGDMPQRT